jgi:hypothetical protein
MTHYGVRQTASYISFAISAPTVNHAGAFSHHKRGNDINSDD